MPAGPSATAAPGEAAASFLQKWHARWPEWRIAEAFIAPAQRPLAVAWFTLLQEWIDAAIAGDEPAPGLAKLAWWQEELRGWAKGARRHPLGEVLRPLPVDWNAIAEALGVLRHREALQGAAAIDVLNPLATALAEAEGVLFGVVPLPAELAVDWLRASGSERVSMSVSDSDHGPNAVATRTHRPRALLQAIIQARRESLPRWRLPLFLWNRARRSQS